jgi:hypothetical protein
MKQFSEIYTLPIDAMLWIKLANPFPCVNLCSVLFNIEFALFCFKICIYFFDARAWSYQHLDITYTKLFSVPLLRYTLFLEDM